MSEHIERDIESAMEARLGRECVFMPSGRFAIYLALELLLSPGDRILMSPLEDDTVFFGALAAGLWPAMAPVSTDDGNMRIDAIDDSTWPTISAVLTGNSYGLPDRVVELSATCGRFEIPLIEDAAHAIETDVDGHPLGSFGAVSAFSLSKHFPGRGGVLALNREISRRDVVLLRDRLMLRRPIGKGAVRVRAIGGQSAAGDAPSHAGVGSRAPPDTSPESRPMASPAACASVGARAFERWPRTI